MRNRIEVDREKSLFSQRLSVIIFGKRTDRLDEWSMDELADISADQEKRSDELKAKLAKAERERDEFKAHMVAMNKGILDSEAWIDEEPKDTYLAFKAVRDLFMRVPAVSLANLEARAIEDTADVFHILGGASYEQLIHRADEIRNSAKESNGE